jgi:hypothetical protein
MYKLHTLFSVERDANLMNWQVATHSRGLFGTVRPFKVHSFNNSTLQQRICKGRIRLDDYVRATGKNWERLGGGLRRVTIPNFN